MNRAAGPFLYFSTRGTAVQILKRSATNIRDWSLAYSFIKVHIYDIQDILLDSLKGFHSAGFTSFALFSKDICHCYTCREQVKQVVKSYLRLVSVLRSY